MRSNTFNFWISTQAFHISAKIILVAFTAGVVTFLLLITYRTNPAIFATALAFLGVQLVMSIHILSRYGISRILIERKSKVQNIKVVEEVKILPFRRKRYLLSDGKIHSITGENTNPGQDYGDYYRLVELFMKEPKKVLFLGGGGCSIPIALSNKYPKVIITVVEKDPDIIDIARQFFITTNLETTMNIVVEDARQFLEVHKGGKYDLIFIDVFIGYRIPNSIVSLEAMERIYSQLTHNGVLILVGVVIYNGRIKRTAKIIFQTMNKVFKNASVFITPPSSKKSFQQVVVYVASRSGNQLRSRDISEFIKENADGKQLLSSKADKRWFLGEKLVFRDKPQGKITQIVSDDILQE